MLVAKRETSRHPPVLLWWGRLSFRYERYQAHAVRSINRPSNKNTWHAMVICSGEGGTGTCIGKKLAGDEVAAFWLKCASHQPDHPEVSGPRVPEMFKGRSRRLGPQLDLKGAVSVGPPVPVKKKEKRKKASGGLIRAWHRQSWGSRRAPPRIATAAGDSRSGSTKPIRRDLQIRLAGPTSSAVACYSGCIEAQGRKKEPRRSPHPGPTHRPSFLAHSSRRPRESLTEASNSRRRCVFIY